MYPINTHATSYARMLSFFGLNKVKVKGALNSSLILL